MEFSRRHFLGASLATAISARQSARQIQQPKPNVHEQSFVPHTFSVVPVVGDGVWISNDPPEEATGNYDPREFDVSVGIKVEGQGAGQQITATTVAPVVHSEQKIKDFRIEAEGCQARLVPLANGAGQLVLKAPSIFAKQTIGATAHFRIQISKSYHGHEQAKFPSLQQEKNLPKDFKVYTKNSPGIKITSSRVKRLYKSLINGSMHPWQQAEKFYTWVWENIEGVPGRYTSVDEAIRKKQGDCEERACTFIALCRTAGIPARQVWVPGHAWAEFGLHDEAGEFHWIPAHTAAYSWFGWTGAHELVLQKGDNIRISNRKKSLRLIDDWHRMSGKRAKFTYTTDITPVAAEGEAVGPGGRTKLPNGRWKLTGDHAVNKIHRNG